jgi:hypothetical protein
MDDTRPPVKIAPRSNRGAGIASPVGSDAGKRWELARESVARALFEADRRSLALKSFDWTWETLPDNYRKVWLKDADAALAAAAPHFAAETRAWAERERNEWATPQGVLNALAYKGAADIASRICGPQQ